MLTKPEEIECVKNAWEPGIADPLRGREDFARIAACFFHDLDLDGCRILDLGPGHYDFGHSLSDSGATVIGYELDPAVIKLGELKGFEVIEGNVNDIEHLNDLRGSFDGLFCRGSFNSRNFEDTEAHQAYLRALISVVKPRGFSWISPCNDPIGALASDTEFERIVTEQIAFFREETFQVYDETDNEIVTAFGISSTAPRLLFTKGFELTRADILKRLSAAPAEPNPPSLLQTLKQWLFG